MIQLGHIGNINSVAFSPNGQFIVSGGEDGLVILRDALKGREIRRFNGHLSITEGVIPQAKGVTSVAFLQNSDFIISGCSDKTVRLWNINTGKEVKRLLHSDSVTSVVSSPNGRFILSVKQFRELNKYLGLAVSPSDQYIAIEGGIYERKTFVYELKTFKKVVSFRHSFHKFSPDCDLLVMDSGDKIRLVNISTRKTVLELSAYEGQKAIFSPDSRFLLLPKHPENTMHLWDIYSGKEIRQFKGHYTEIISTTFSPDGRYILSYDADKTQRLWEVSSGKELCRLISLNNGNGVVVTPEGRFDANNVEEIKGLHWIILDDPLNSLPQEIIMRDYYEPRLLPRLLYPEKHE